MSDNIMEQQFLNIFDNEKADDIISFLKTLSVDERKKIGKFIVKLKNDKEDTRENSTTNNQYTILSIALFVCLDYSPYKRNSYTPSYMGNGFIGFNSFHQGELMKRISLDDVLEWYCPDWFDKYLNNPRDNEGFKRASYKEIMRWYDKGYIKTLSPEMVAETLSHMPFSYSYDDNWKGIGQFTPKLY